MVKRDDTQSFTRQLDDLRGEMRRDDVSRTLAHIITCKENENKEAIDLKIKKRFIKSAPTLTILSSLSNAYRFHHHPDCAAHLTTPPPFPHAVLICRRPLLPPPCARPLLLRQRTFSIRWRHVSPCCKTKGGGAGG